MVDPAPTWAQAVADGVLVDITAEARRVGIVCKVAITRAAWGECIMCTFAEYRAGLWPLSRLRLLMVAVRETMASAPCGQYTAHLWHAVERVDGHTVHHLEVIATPCGGGEFVITIALVKE